MRCGLVCVFVPRAMRWCLVCFVQIYLNAQSDFDGATSLDLDPSQVLNIGPGCFFFALDTKPALTWIGDAHHRNDLF